VHDPGKNVFHLLLLPLAAYLIFQSFPALLVPEGVRLIRDRTAGVRRIAAAVLLVALAGLTLLGTALVIGDAGDFRNETQVVGPAQFGDPGLRECMWDLDQDLRDAVASGGLTPERASNIYRSVLHPDLSASDLTPDLVAQIDTCRGLAPSVLGFGDLSTRAYIGFVLSWFGAMIACLAVYLSMAAALLLKPDDDAKVRFTNLFLAVLLLILWLGLRPYSEWYGSLYTTTNAPVIVVGLIAGVAAAFFCYLHSTKSNPITVAGVLAAISVLSTILGIAGSKTVMSLFEALSESWVFVVSAEVLVACMVVGFVLWYAVELEQRRQLAHNEPRPGGTDGEVE
jgi:hypothetical protein